MSTPLSTPRLYYLDNLKVWLTTLVVAHHVAQAYGPTGGEWPVSEAQRSPFLAPFITINSIFFMGAFFFVSGYLTPRPYDHKGFRAFARDRLLRLGVPSLIIAAILTAATRSFTFAHMWYAIDLLALSLMYGAYRSRMKITPTVVVAPPNASLLSFTLFLGIVTAGIRVWYPVDYWIMILGVFPIELAHAPQYLFLFLAGLVAYRSNWLPIASRRVLRLWGCVALMTVIGFTLWRLVPGWRKFHVFDTGGATWQNVIYSTFEAFTSVGILITSLGLFRRYAGGTTPFLRLLSDNAYGVYFLHIFVVIPVQLLLKPLTWDSLAKFGVATVLSLTGSFLLSHFVLRKLPCSNRIF
ncbi:MAG: acyltransferase family protein [Akkermansiaceae bacterium]|nr:acyltransferase family protein [Armatimonadota bacterium]